MNFEEFENLIKKNSEYGRKTEFLKISLSIDDYRKSQPTDYGIQETFVAAYDKNQKTFVIYYPDEEKEIKLNEEDAEDEFYNNAWGTYIHK